MCAEFYPIDGTASFVGILRRCTWPEIEPYITHLALVELIYMLLAYTVFDDQSTYRGTCSR
ncbi:MAG: hypothetical protein OXN84_15185 [Albidovulum sp.]|nr:hypothetical protein [Albidovulum sp.]